MSRFSTDYTGIDQTQDASLHGSWHERCLSFVRHVAIHGCSFKTVDNWRTGTLLFLMKQGYSGYRGSCRNNGGGIVDFGNDGLLFDVAICGCVWVQKLPSKVRKTENVSPFAVIFIDCDLCHGMTLSRSPSVLAHHFLVYKSALRWRTRQPTTQLLPRHGPVLQTIQLGKHPSFQGPGWHSRLLSPPPCSNSGWSSPSPIRGRARQAQEHHKTSSALADQRSIPFVHSSGHAGRDRCCVPPEILVSSSFPRNCERVDHGCRTRVGGHGIELHSSRT